MIRRNPLLLFIGLSYSLSWLCWAPLVLAKHGLISSHPSQYLHFLGALGPALAALITARAHGGRSGLRSLLERLRAWRIPPIWHLVAWVSPGALLLVSVAVLYLIRGEPWDPALFGRSAEYPQLPGPVYWVASIVFYGFGEETGWRGYALPHLQQERSAFVATLFLSVIWALWHLPLFAFSPGLSRMGVAKILGWYFSILTGAILFTWLMNSTGSVLIAAVFHGTMDIVFVSPGPASLTTLLGALITIWGVIILFVAGPRHLSRRGKIVMDKTGTLTARTDAATGIQAHSHNPRL
jgi:membrane protease YdiL (CAAX protease family)